jgi:hypothetical protein
VLVISENNCQKKKKKKEGLETNQHLNLDSLYENNTNTIFENKNRIQPPNIPLNSKTPISHSNPPSAEVAHYYWPEKK